MLPAFPLNGRRQPLPRWRCNFSPAGLVCNTLAQPKHAKLPLNGLSEKPEPFLPVYGTISKFIFVVIS